MTAPESPSNAVLGNKAFVVLLAIVSVAFAAVIWPFFGAAFWGMVLAIVFAPLYRRLLPRCRGNRTGAALATLGVILVLVILPVVSIGVALVGEASALTGRLKGGQIDFGQQFEQITNALPAPVQRLLERFGLDDFGALTKRAGQALNQGGQEVAKRALDLGQNTLDIVVSFFIALYLTVFLLRDGADLSARIREALPLDARHKQRLFATFATVIRATVKGNILVAATQGALGGLAFWALGVRGAMLWAVVMGFLSLLPAIGAGLVWAPVALYFLATGAAAKGFGLIAYGVLVIGLVDNVLRPILVGKDIRMPDYLVLFSTLGGIALFGLNGFVIGPVIAAMFLAVWGIVLAEQREQG